MRRRKRALSPAVAGTVLLALLLSGCGGGGGGKAATATTQASTSSVPSTVKPTTTVAVATTANAPTTQAPATAGEYSFAKTTTFVDDQGYSYKVSISFTEGPAKMGNSSTLPPSQYAIDLPVSGSISITNTTPGRAAPDPFPLSAVDVNGLWKVPSPLCASPNLDGTGAGIGPDAVHDEIGSTWYCNAATLVTFQDDTQGNDFKVGQTVTEKLGPVGVCESTQSNNGCVQNIPTNADVFVYSQPEAGQVLNELKTKPDVVLAYWGFGKKNADDICTASTDDAGTFAWLISSTQSLPATNCSSSS